MSLAAHICMYRKRWTNRIVKKLHKEAFSSYLHNICNIHKIWWYSNHKEFSLTLFKLIEIYINNPDCLSHGWLPRNAHWAIRFNKQINAPWMNEDDRLFKYQLRLRSLLTNAPQQSIDKPARTSRWAPQLLMMTSA